MTLKIGFEKENWMFKKKKSSKKIIQNFLLFCSIGCAPYIFVGQREEGNWVFGTLLFQVFQGQMQRFTTLLLHG